MSNRIGKKVRRIFSDIAQSDVPEDTRPYQHKKCAECGKPSHQGFNGRWYCDKHHPQRLCDGCGANLGRYKVGLNTLCGACIERNRQNGDTQSN